MRELLTKLPTAFGKMLFDLMDLAYSLHQNRAKNLMSSKNLSVVFSPSILRDRNETTMVWFFFALCCFFDILLHSKSLIQDMDASSICVNTLIKHFGCCRIDLGTGKWRFGGNRIATIGFDLFCVCCSHAADYNDELESNEKPSLSRVSGSTNDLRGSGAEARTSGSAAPKFQKGTVSVRSAGSLVRVFPLFFPLFPSCSILFCCCSRVDFVWAAVRKLVVGQLLLQSRTIWCCPRNLRFRRNQSRDSNRCTAWKWLIRRCWRCDRPTTNPMSILRWCRLENREVRCLLLEQFRFRLSMCRRELQLRAQPARLLLLETALLRLVLLVRLAIVRFLLRRRLCLILCLRQTPMWSQKDRNLLALVCCPTWCWLRQILRLLALREIVANEYSTNLQ